MDARQSKALHIAATTALAPNNGRWKVPSQSGTGHYAVLIAADGSWFCGCPDFEERLAPCKHIMAVEITVQRETGDGQRVTYSETVKATYSQSWSAYNAAQCDEKRMVMNLLTNLCAGIRQPEQATGRPRHALSDVAFALVAKVYAGTSARRFTSDLNAAKDAGQISKVPGYNTLLRYMADPAMTDVLTDLVELSALPLAEIETDFAVDSSGFGTSNLRTWFSTKHGREMTEREWCKVHLMAGTRTHIVSAAVVTPSNANDAPFLPELAKTTAKSFDVREISADKGYVSKANTAAIEDLGATPYIPFKSNAVRPAEGSAWSRMWHRFAYDRETFLASYHKRSNVETVFHMVKAKFGDTLFSKSHEAQRNEVLAKVVAHNLCVLVQAFYELGIEADFAAVSS
jgi:transposase